MPKLLTCTIITLLASLVGTVFGQSAQAGYIRLGGNGVSIQLGNPRSYPRSNHGYHDYSRPPQNHNFYQPPVYSQPTTITPYYPTPYFVPTQVVVPYSEPSVIITPKGTVINIPPVIIQNSSSTVRVYQYHPYHPYYGY
jgi:hypothetical protein